LWNEVKEVKEVNEVKEVKEPPLLRPRFIGQLRSFAALRMTSLRTRLMAASIKRFTWNKEASSEIIAHD